MKPKVALLVFSGYAVKNRWRNLRDCYSKHLKSIKITTGQATGKYKLWQWSKQMEFMKEHLAFAQTTTNLGADISIPQEEEETP
jgi:hypothetical protein